MAVTEILGESKPEIVIGVATGIELGLNPNGIYGTNPANFSISEDQNPFVLVTPIGYVGVETTGPYRQVSNMAAALTEARQPLAEGGLVIGAAFFAAGLVRAAKYFGKNAG